jgi:ribonuclease III
MFLESAFNMNYLEQLTYLVPEIERKINYVFRNKTLLLQALLHSSYFNECVDKKIEHNERLEFLGDAVLGLIVSEYLYLHLPRHEEGYLSQLRSQIVNAATCALLCQSMGLDRYILLGKGERLSGGKGRESIYADLFEAVVGAIYLDGGWDFVKQFTYGYILPHIEKAIKAPLRNWKAELQDYTQKKYQTPPQYRVMREMGPDHNKTFHIAVFIGDRELGTGTGSSKKEGEMRAAQDALNKL